MLCSRVCAVSPLSNPLEPPPWPGLRLVLLGILWVLSPLGKGLATMITFSAEPLALRLTLLLL